MRVWIKTESSRQLTITAQITLFTEGADQNSSIKAVDNNCTISLSLWRAWIKITALRRLIRLQKIALFASVRSIECLKTQNLRFPPYKVRSGGLLYIYRSIEQYCKSNTFMLSLKSLFTLQFSQCTEDR